MISSTERLRTNALITDTAREIGERFDKARVNNPYEGRFFVDLSGIDGRYIREALQFIERAERLDGFRIESLTEGETPGSVAGAMVVAPGHSLRMAPLA